MESSLDGDYWKDLVIGAMITMKDNEIDKSKAIQEYFMKASKSSPQYRFRKGLEVFRDDSKVAAMKELKTI